MEKFKWLTRGRLILIISIIAVLVISFFSIKYISNNRTNKYKKFESELVSAAENYFEIKDMSIEDGEEKKITLSQLKKQNLVYDELQNKCDGYVLIISDKDIYTDDYKITYNAYIKCGNKYRTPNYSEY